MTTRLEDFRFVLGKPNANNTLEIIHGQDTEEGIVDLYGHLLIQSDNLDSEYHPYQRREDGIYARLWDLESNVQRGLKEERGKNMNNGKNPKNYVM